MKLATAKGLDAGQAVEVWPASGDPQRYVNLKLLDAGPPPFQGLQLQLEEIWAA
jgi:hypothetical protein